MKTQNNSKEKWTTK